MISFEGEGKGRVHLTKKKYVFNFESFFKNNEDWALAISVPFQGEEVILLKGVISEQSDKKDLITYEQRNKIEKQLARLEALRDIPAHQIIKSFRDLMRFHLLGSLRQKYRCHKTEAFSYHCFLNHGEQKDFDQREPFKVIVEKEKVFVQKKIDQNFYFLTSLDKRDHQHFKYFSVSLKSSLESFLKSKKQNSENLFSLELFF